MAVDTEKLKTARAGFTQEETEGQYANAKAGLWRHPETGEEAITLDDPLYGDVQSQAFARVGFIRVGDVDRSQIKELVTPSLQLEADKKPISDNTDEVKGILARLNAAEAEVARLKAKETSGVEVPGTEPVKGAEETKQAAADKVEDQTGIAVDPTTGNLPGQFPVVDAKPLEEQNESELRETAEREGLVFTDEQNTVKKKRAAIQEARDKKEKDAA